MTVHLNANSFDEISFCPPWEKDGNPIAVPVKKEKLEEFFPRTQRELPGYLCKETFKSKLATIMRGILEGMKSSRDEMENLAAQNTQGGYLNPALKPKAEDYPKKLNEFHHAQHVRQIYMELKSRILEAIEREDWYSFEKLEMADKVYEESKQYFKAAGTEVAMFAVGFGIGKIGKPIAKSSKTLKGNILQQDVGLTKAGKAAKATTKTGKAAKTIPVNRTWSKEYTYEFMGKKQKLTVLEGDLINGNVAAINYDMGLWSEHSHPEDSFESYDCLKDFGLPGVAASVVVPYIGIGATITNVFYNTLLGFKYRSSSKRIRAIEEETQRKDAEFLSKLKNLICDDFNALNNDEIEALVMKLLHIDKESFMKLLGINKNN